MKVLVIVNPTASNGKGLTDYKNEISGLLENILGKFDVVFTESQEHAWKIAKKAEGYDRVISVGGDGTLNEVVNGLIEGGHDIPVGIIGVGTGNDFIRTLGIPNNYPDMVKNALGNKFIECDLLYTEFTDFNGRVQKRYAVNVVGTGFDAAVTTRFNRLRFKFRGTFSYLMSFFIEFLVTGTYPLNLEIDGRKLDTEQFFMVFGNGKYFGGGMKICPLADPSDGKIDIVGITKMPKLKLFCHFPDVYKGEHLKVNPVLHNTGRVIKIEGKKETLIEMDGEVVGKLPMTIKIVDRALKIASA
ncbi:MAG: diacylglycerol kinase [Kosmotoga sp.]|nr:diacylglycerol kinase [Kosmotoga sp.]